MELKQAWDQKTIRNGMRVAGRGRITKAAFAIEPRFDGIKASEDLIDKPQAPPSDSRKRPATESRQKYSNKRTRLNPCWGCEGNHSPYTCTLIKDSNPRKLKISEKSKNKFEEKMKDKDFAGKIRKIREAEEIRKELWKPNVD
jgi:hypothetical protein